MLINEKSHRKPNLVRTVRDHGIARHFFPFVVPDVSAVGSLWMQVAVSLHACIAVQSIMHMFSRTRTHMSYLGTSRAPTFMCQFCIPPVADQRAFEVPPSGPPCEVKRSKLMDLLTPCHVVEAKKPQKANRHVGTTQNRSGAWY